MGNLELSNKAKLFFSYSHKDEILREELNTHLSLLKRNGLIEEWHDRKIIPGQNWESEIDSHLVSADIVILLVSPDFIASDYCYGNELSKAIERHEANQIVVIPIIIRPTGWQSTPFSKFQALPKDAKAVTTWTNIDEAWIDVAQGIEEAILNIAKLKKRRAADSGLKHVSELLVNEANRIDQIYQSEDSNCSGIPTGLLHLDTVTDGLHPADLIILASRPGNGVEDLALNIAKHVGINAGLPVAYFSFQNSANRLTQKLICTITNINHHKLLRGQLEEEDWVNLTTAIATLADAPFYIHETNTLSLLELISYIKELKVKFGFALIIIDSIQSLIFQSELKTNHKEYVRPLKYLAKELQVPILITSNVSPEAEQRPDKRPYIKDLSELKSAEEDADLVIFTYIDQVYNPDTMDKGLIELLVAKNSYGPVGTIQAIYYAEDSPVISDWISEYNQFKDEKQ